MDTTIAAPARYDYRDQHRGRILDTALGYAAFGWPVLPGSTWDGCRYVDPATGASTQQIRPVVPREHASTLPSAITRWWSANSGLVPTVLLRVGVTFDVLSVRRGVAELLTARPRFRSAPGPVLYRPDLGRAYILVTPGDHRLGGFDPEIVHPLPTGEVLVVPPARLGIGVNATWWVSPNHSAGALADRDLVRELLVETTARTPSRKTRRRPRDHGSGRAGERGVNVAGPHARATAR